jgi:membrane protease YdiL (CAAX protease family)
LNDETIVRDLRGFGPLGIIAIVLILFAGGITLGNIIVPAGAVLVLLWTRLSRTRWAEVGYARPKSWSFAIIGGIAGGIALKFLMKALVMPLFGATPVNQPYHYLAGNRTLLPAAIWAMFTAGFGEETVFRGWAFERLRRLMGDRRNASLTILVLTSAWFGLSHIPNQGRDGAIQATITGLVFGSLYLATGTIWLPMIVHTVFDLTALWMIYRDVEGTIAHLIFK